MDYIYRGNSPIGKDSSGWNLTPEQERVLKEMRDLWDNPVKRKELLERCERTYKELSDMPVNDMFKQYGS